MSFIYCHLNFHANLLRPWRFPLTCKPLQIAKLIIHIFCQISISNTVLGARVAQQAYHQYVMGSCPEL